ncbi:MAG: toll/interleukin-1 receptor domain-containing protein [Deltaproteobacteria bacterium]|nr:toll/interleukin-1 receptor domain-containing protein [Deltaproteobacteria bacterium]
MPDKFDVFLSYAHADSEWVRRLAENLHQSGLNVFFDEWEIGPKDVLAHRLDTGILNSRTGVLVVTPTALSQHAALWKKVSLSI